MAFSSLIVVESQRLFVSIIVICPFRVNLAHFDQPIPAASILIASVRESSIERRGTSQQQRAAAPQHGGLQQQFQNLVASNGVHVHGSHDSDEQ